MGAMGQNTDRIRLELANRHWGLRRVAVTLVGFVLLLVGLALLVLPGPGLVVLAVGFGILATEYVWAWRAQRYVQSKARDAGRRAWLRPRQGPRRVR